MSILIEALDDNSQIKYFRKNLLTVGKRINETELNDEKIYIIGKIKPLEYIPIALKNRLIEYGYYKPNQSQIINIPWN